HGPPITAAIGETRGLGAACEPGEPRARRAIGHAFLAHGLVRLDCITRQTEIEQHTRQLAGPGADVGKCQLGAGQADMPDKARQSGLRIFRAVDVGLGETGKVAVTKGRHSVAPSAKPRALMIRSSTASGERLPSFSMTTSGCSGSCAGRSIPTTLSISPRSARR